MASRLPRQVKQLGAVSLLNDFASEMVYPLLPAFVTTVLGAGAAALGALDGAAEFAAAVMKQVTGRLADRAPRRRQLVILGYAVAVVVRPIIALTGAAWHVIGLRVVDRVGKGIRTPARDAIIADATPPELRGRAFGLQRGLDHTGAILGPLVAWLLLSSGTLGVRGVIATSIVPGVLVLVLAMVAVKGGEGRVEGWNVGRLEREAPSNLPTSQPSPRLSPSLLAIAGFHLLRVPETLVILRAQQLGVAVAAVTVLWAALHVVKAGSSVLGGRLSDRLGPRRTMLVGWVLYGTLAVGFALADSVGQAWALFLAVGLVSGLTESPERALVAGEAGSRQGSGFGRYHALTGVAALVGGVALGLVYQRAGGAAAFWASAAAAGALVAFSIIRRLGMRAIAIAVALVTAGSVAAAQDRQVIQMPGASVGLPFSTAVRVGNMLYLSGQIGNAPGQRQLADTGVTGQTRQTLENIKAVLLHAGSSLERVVKCTVFLVDIRDFAAMNAVYVTYFPKDPPARSTVAGSGLALGARVEIECIATVGTPSAP